ncbi:RING finger protein 37 [Contarinia nasturtii]|uniref:RING finger protein 37 n=1 Tax=Contarinia nasturtii TaxID=265458 RepID=UPI0012D3EDCB|nr:RING finger protein 37 [Contarinia nasturtii]
MDSNKLVVNFLDPSFGITKINCSCAVDDFYSVENLVSSDAQKLSRGFMAYSVVKPPVELEIHLSHTIQLYSIKIWPQINSLKSIGFEIYVGGDVNDKYNKIASHFNLEENGIQFVNSMDNIDHTDANFIMVPFYSSARYKLRKVQNIKLVIKQTAKCVPVIKRMEVWGTISQFASKEQRVNFHQMMERKNQQNENAKSVETPSNIASNSVPCLNPTIDVPEEFLDTLTYEIMALPMVLPSGKVIDYSTLQKHTQQEEKWGRVASDPFTFQPFTETRKPVLNTHLKSQIDSFLLKNNTAPRTVGNCTKRKLQDNGECSNWAKKTFGLPAPSTATQTNSQTLDEAIRNTLNVGKYTTYKDNESNDNKCFQCLKVANNTILYEIRICSHFICRNCLVNNLCSICSCGKEFSNLDVTRHHQKMTL